MAGRKRKPAALKKLEGTFRSDRAKDSLEVPAGLPPKPTWADVDPVASALYDEVATHCYKMGVGTEADGLAFALLADQLSIYLRLRAAVAADGPLVDVMMSNGAIQQKTHPALAQMNSSYGQIVKMMTEFGLTAAARTKVDATKPIEADSFEAFLES